MCSVHVRERRHSGRDATKQRERKRETEIQPQLLRKDPRLSSPDAGSVTERRADTENVIRAKSKYNKTPHWCSKRFPNFFTPLCGSLSEAALPSFCGLHRTWPAPPSSCVRCHLCTLPVRNITHVPYEKIHCKLSQRFVIWL